VGKLLLSSVGRGVAAGTAVGAIDSLVELQAVIASNPNKTIKRNFNIFFMPILCN
jgi:hypothetical protein